MRSWILLRGWAREARHWGDFPAQLKAVMPEARIVALDLPGNGQLYRRPSPLTVGSMVERCRESLRSQDAARPYYLFGLSLGGMVSTEWASRHPEEVAACVLVNTSLRPFNSFRERLRPRSYGTLLRLAFIERDPRAREAAILHLTSARRGPRTDLISSWARYGEEQPVSRLNALRQVAAAARYRAPDAPPVPILVLAGAGDRLVDAKCSENLARRWKVPIAVHPTAGHDLTLDDGPWAAAQVARWIARRDQQSASA